MRSDSRPSSAAASGGKARRTRIEVSNTFQEKIDMRNIVIPGARMVGFYVWFTQRRIGQILPEDNLTALISDGAGDLGFYSPHSWWPLPVALSMCALTLSLIIGWWLTVISLGALVISIIGMVTEYEKPATVSAH